MAFAQERIAVFPFEDLDNVFTRNEPVMFYRQFSNEFSNRNAGRFIIIPRQEVEKLINTEMAFQLTDFSAREKTAEMNRVLNGTRILSGIIARVGNGITISVSLYTYPDLQQLPGGVDLSVANTNELFDKIPELVQRMQSRMSEGTSRTVENPPARSQHEQPPKPTRQPIKLPAFFNDETKLWSIGLNIGSSFANPFFIVNANITLAPFPYTFLELGADMGLGHGKAGDLEIKDVEYLSWYYYGRFNVFIPIWGEGGGWYIGLGGGFMDAHFKFPTAEASVQIPAFDAASGFFIGDGHHLFRISYALRTNFSGINHRIMLGYTLRICDL